jgi:hypothetical protein
MDLTNLPAFFINCNSLAVLAQRVAAQMTPEDIQQWKQLREILGQGDPFMQRFHGALEQALEKKSND